MTSNARESFDRKAVVVRDEEGREWIDRDTFVNALALARSTDLDDRSYYAVLDIITPDEIVDD